MAEAPENTKLPVIAVDITVAILALLVGLALFGTYLEKILSWYYGLLESFYSANWTKINKILAIIFSFINAGLVGFIIFAMRRYLLLIKRVPDTEPTMHIVTPREEVRENWEHIRALANSSSPSDWNMAILRADALLDDILKHLGYEGETMAERLKIVSPSTLPSLERLWSAHRLRNMIAHDPLEQHTKETIIHALRSYEEALKELKMMEETPS